MFKSISFLSILAVSNIAFGNSFAAINQDPTNVHIFPNPGMFVFYANVNTGEAPSCAGDNRWSIKTDKAGAKELISMVIAAKVANRKINVHGTGICNPDGFGYEIKYLNLN